MQSIPRQIRHGEDQNSNARSAKGKRQLVEVEGCPKLTDAIWAHASRALLIPGLAALGLARDASAAKQSRQDRWTMHCDYLVTTT